MFEFKIVEELKLHLIDGVHVMSYLVQLYMQKFCPYCSHAVRNLNMITCNDWDVQQNGNRENDCSRE